MAKCLLWSRMLDSGIWYMVWNDVVDRTANEHLSPHQASFQTVTLAARTPVHLDVDAQCSTFFSSFPASSLI